MQGFWKVKRAKGDNFLFKFKSQKNFELSEAFVDLKEWDKFDDVFVYQEPRVTSYRIGPINCSELKIIE